MTLFSAGALLMLLASVSGVDATFKAPPKSLTKAAIAAYKTNPKLQRRELQRKTAFLRKVQGLAVNKKDQTPARLLQNDQYNYNNNNGYGNNQYNDDQQQQSAYDQNNFYWNQNMAEQDFGFDISDYSFKYVGCATVKTFKDDVAAEEYDNDDYNAEQNQYNYYNGNQNYDEQYNQQYSQQYDNNGNNYNAYSSNNNYWQQQAQQEDQYNDVLVAERFATFRLCPRYQCNDNSRMGCNGNNYGEYLVSLDQFLETILAFNAERVRGYCQYCQQCSDVESFKLFVTEIQAHKQVAIATAYIAYQNWLADYQANYASNNNGNYQANNGDDQYANQNAYQEDDAALAEKYWQVIRNGQDQQWYYGGNNNNNYNNNDDQSQQQSSQMANGYWFQYNQNNYGGANDQWTQNQQFWNIKNSDKNQANYQNWESMNYGNSGSNNWSMWYGKKILNGYYDQNGDFVQQWGYFSGYGEYVSLEEDAAIVWDETIFGNMPSDWSDQWFQYPDQVQTCDNQYAGSCYTQYDQCMQVLGNEDYDYYMAYTYGEEYYKAKNQISSREMIQCTQISPNNENIQNLYAQKYDYTSYGSSGSDASGYNFQSDEMKEYADAAYYAQQECDQYDYDCKNEKEYYQSQVDYLERSFQKQLNRPFYVGPRCDNDHDIVFAIYRDQYCSSYDETYTVEDLLGYNPLSDDESLLPEECVPCAGSSLTYKSNTNSSSSSSSSSSNGNYNNNADNAEDSEEDYNGNENVQWYEDEDLNQEQFDDGIEPLCSMLYQFAGKCNQNLHPGVEYGGNYDQYNDYQYNDDAGADAQEYDYDQQNAQNNGVYNYQSDEGSTGWKLMYQSQAQAANEELVCSFIQSLNSGTYNELGEVVLDGSNSWGDQKAWNNMAVDTSLITAGRKAGLTLAAFAAAAMAVVACYLHDKLARKNIPWKPRRKPGEDPTDIARQNSGIVMGRSRSGAAANAPLI